MRCPECGHADMVHDTRDMPYTYKGQETIIPAVSGHYCLACDEIILETADAQRVSEAMIAFTRQVNATLADPVFIRQVRQRLGLDQRQAAQIFGGGPNAFSRYETGRAKPPVAVLKLLALLDRHPYLLDELR